MLDTLIIQQCAPMINHQLMQSVISVESSHNPYAIGVVNAHLLRQPQKLSWSQSDSPIFRASRLQLFSNEINSTTDPKSIAELQARIAGEQTKVQNGMMQMQLSAQLAEVKNKLVIQQQKEANYAAAKARVGAVGTYPVPITDWH